MDRWPANAWPLDQAPFCLVASPQHLQDCLLCLISYVVLCRFPPHQRYHSRCSAHREAIQLAAASPLHRVFSCHDVKPLTPGHLLSIISLRSPRRRAPIKLEDKEYRPLGLNGQQDSGRVLQYALYQEAVPFGGASRSVSDSGIISSTA